MDEGGCVCEGWEWGGGGKVASLGARCFPLLCQAPLNLLHHSNMVPSITGTPPSRQSTQEQRGRDEQPGQTAT